jgi:hypothetical protein
MAALAVAGAAGPAFADGGTTLACTASGTYLGEPVYSRYLVTTEGPLNDFTATEDGVTVTCTIAGPEAAVRPPEGAPGGRQVPLE